MTDFEHKLTEGQQLEKAVVKKLQELLPDYKVINTLQDNDIDRYIYSLIDVVVEKDDHILFGIECKLGKEKLKNCKVVNGWDGDYNTVINRSSLHKYKQASFPVWVMNVNVFCHKIFTADLPTLLKSPNDGGKYVKHSGDTRYNVDSRSWKVYEGDNVKLDTVLKDIIKEVC